jgi:hypothetical protein
VKYSRARDGKMRFNKIRQGNEVKWGEIRKKVGLRNATGETSFN